MVIIFINACNPPHNAAYIIRWPLVIWFINAHNPPHNTAYTIRYVYDNRLWWQSQLNYTIVMSKKRRKSRQYGAPPIPAERCRSLPNSIVLHAAPQNSTKLSRAPSSSIEINRDLLSCRGSSSSAELCRAITSSTKLHQAKAIMNTEASRPFDPQYSPSYA